MLNMKILGTEKLLAALDPDEAIKNTRKALRAASSIVLRAAKGNALRDVLKRRTGDLGTSVTQDVNEGALRAIVGTKLVYGPVHEYGATIRPIPPNKWLRFQFAPRGKNVTKRGNYPWVSVRQVVIPKRPWLRPAYEDNKDKILRTFRAGLERSLKP